MIVISYAFLEAHIEMHEQLGSYLLPQFSSDSLIACLKARARLVFDHSFR